MLTITIPGDEVYNEETEEFFTIGDVTLELEHSLLSISKWESIWEKPFLGADKKTPEETLSYIHCMIVTPDFPPGVISRLTNQQINDINAYIGAKMSATWFNEAPNAKQSREVVTAEIVYYWMVSLNIPFECERWHFSRLITLIKVCNQKNAPAKKMSKAEIAAHNRMLNEKRKRDLGTQG